MEIGVKTLSQENSSNVIESTLAQLDLAEMSSVDVSLDLSPADIVELVRTENDLAVELTSGETCLLYTSPSPRDKRQSRMPSSA